MRRRLSDLITAEAARTLDVSPPQEAPERPHAVSTPPARTRSTAGPRYRTLLRKEARLREDQVIALVRLARRLHRLASPAPERITENTLLRVAVDYLLRHASALRGTTEAELLESLVQASALSSAAPVPGVPESGSPVVR